MQIEISGIPVFINKKKIKNLHLYVKPPSGRVEVSAPLLMNVKAIENFVRINLGWVKKQQLKFEGQPRIAERKYITGEIYYIWGKQYLLQFENSKKRFFKIDGNRIILGMKITASIKQREKYVRKEYRKILISQLDRLVPKWEEKTGFYCASYKTKYMTTRWGTCNAKARRIWINLQMAEKPLECLEYIILHELVHLKIPNHGSDFKEEMNKNMPDWRERKKLLNGIISDRI